MKASLLDWVERAERAIYWAVGIVLIPAAAVLLGYTVWQAVITVVGGEYVYATLRLFDRTLFALMLAQIVYTTLNFLKKGVLQVEPVLVVGIIAVVRRILVMTAVMGGTIQATGTGEAGPSFNQMMVELALLAVTVLALAIAVYLVRRSPDRELRKAAGTRESSGGEKPR